MATPTLSERGAPATTGHLALASPNYGMPGVCIPETFKAGRYGYNIEFSIPTDAGQVSADA